jgi:hypothetical protein
MIFLILFVVKNYFDFDGCGYNKMQLVLYKTQPLIY